jgi:lipopolysaccharide/colanic/teichoic acid biosynthesis glycosyltransferase
LNWNSDCEPLLAATASDFEFVSSTAESAFDVSSELDQVPSDVLQQLSWAVKFAKTKRSRHLFHCFTKRTADLLLIATSLPVWLPLLGICCLLVKMESPSAPVFFVQQRTGRDGRRFALYKIRTMIRNADGLRASVAHLNHRGWPDFKITDAEDPRITRIGRILRRAHLDELPQLLNVVRGDMSLIGPRPTSVPIELYKPWHNARLNVRPGISGLWQLVQERVDEFDARVQIDILYIERCCWLLDVIIIWQTIIYLLKLCLQTPNH